MEDGGGYRRKTINSVRGMLENEKGKSKVSPSFIYLRLDNINSRDGLSI